MSSHVVANWAIRTIFILVVCFVPALSAHAQFDPDQSYSNDIQPIEIDGKFEPLGKGLAGDSIEHDRGTLSFRHVDVSIPGNSSLPVEFARKYAVHGTSYFGNQLGGWQIDVPFITTRMKGPGGYTPGGSHPTWPKCFLNAVDRGGTSMDDTKAYYQGFKMNIPGEGMKAVMEVPDNATAAFPYESQHTTLTATTIDHWQIYCEEEDGSPVVGVVAISPSGTKYEFDLMSVTPAGIEASTQSIGGRRGDIAGDFVFTYHYNLLATKVTDVHGNWVEYDYETEYQYNEEYEVCTTVPLNGVPTYACNTNLNNNWSGPDYFAYRLNSITSNDGRQINVNYNGPNNDPTLPSFIQYPEEGLMTTVSSVTANGRTWTYEYDIPSIPNYGPINSLRVLRGVELPDGREWYLNLPLQNHRAYRGHNSYECTAADSPNYARPWPMHWLSDVYVEHPSGARADYEFEIIKNPIWKLGSLSSSTICNDPDPEFAISNAVVQKTITAPNSPTATWLFSYAETASTISGLGDVKQRVETRPDGSTVTRYITVHNEGDEVRKVIAASGVSYVENIQYTAVTSFDEHDTIGVLDDNKRYKTPKLKRATQVTITSDGSTFQTTSSFNTNLSSSNYSYGAPISITETGTGPGSRVANITYVHEKDDWVLGLVNTVTKNNKLFDDFNYDAKGRVIEHKKFGVTIADIGYFTSGAEAGRVSTLTLLGKDYALSSYKRGIPRTILLPDGNTLSRAVNNDGWVTSQTDARNITTSYQYNSVGWLASIDRPDPWADTSFSYSGLGNGLTQTATRGNSRTVTSFDGYHRPYLVKAEDLTGYSSPVFSKTGYDGTGRVIFSSFPSHSSNPLSGTSMTYDGLGRVIQAQENVSPFATTSTEYLSGDCVEVTDPSLAVTTTCFEGYGSPGKGLPVSIVQPEGMTTTMDYDIHGNLLTANQSGSGKSFTQHWTYDSRLQLCGFRTPETGLSRYHRNDAGQVTYYAEGLAGTGCGSVGSNYVSLTYDAMGRLENTIFPGGTDIISRDYDANGNLTDVDRGGVSWDYLYNSLGLLESEALSVDGHSMVLNYDYNPSGHLTTQYGLSQSLTFAPDGFGRPTQARWEYGEISYVSDVAYHPNGTVAEMTYGNDADLIQTLNARQLLSSQAVIANQYVVSHNYSYNARGQVTGISNNLQPAATRTFDYDQLGRLVEADGIWGAATFEYDPINNILEKRLGSRIVALSYNANNRLSSLTDSAGGGAQAWSYDSRGNVLDNGQNTMTYDWANQPVSLTAPGLSETHTYDGNLKRVKTVRNGQSTYFFYSSQTGKIAYSWNTATSTKTRYIPLGGMTVARTENFWTPTYLHVDHLGSPIAATNSAGNLAWREHYSPFGEKIYNPVANKDKTGFTGHVEDSLAGLTYMQARYYDPVAGRFLSKDPVTFADKGAAYFNRYAYTANDPVNATDPTGLLACRGDEKVCEELQLEASYMQAALTELSGQIKQLAADIEAGNPLSEAQVELQGDIERSFKSAGRSVKNLSVISSRLSTISKKLSPNDKSIEVIAQFAGSDYATVDGWRTIAVTGVGSKHRRGNFGLGTNLGQTLVHELAHIVLNQVNYMPPEAYLYVGISSRPLVNKMTNADSYACLASWTVCHGTF